VRILAQHIAVVAYHGSAARGRHYNGLERSGVELAVPGIDIGPRHAQCLILAAQMMRQSAATALARGDGHFASVLLQYTHRRFVQPRETDVGDAPAEKRDAISPLTFGRQRFAVVGEEERRLDLRRQCLQLAQPGRKKTGHRDQPLQTADRVEMQHRSGDFNTEPRRKQFAKNKPTQHSLAPWPPDCGFDFGSRRFH